MNKFVMYRYRKRGYSQWFYVVRDTSKQIWTRGAYFVADQSSYPEDNLKMVWKHAAYPSSVHDVVMRDPNHEVVATATHIDFLVCS